MAFDPSPTTSPRLLLTGFEPFVHFLINPSWIAAQRAAEAFPSQVIAHCLPVDHHRSRQALLKLLTEIRPQAVLAMGLAAGDTFRIERLARKPVEFTTITGRPDHHITMDLDRIASPLARLNVPWRYSDDAGQYVCESTYWTLLQFMAEQNLDIPCGFLHVPADTDTWPAQRTAGVVVEVVRELLAEGKLSERM